MTFFKKIRTNISILWHSLFRGLAAADAVMESQGSVGADGSEIVQQKSGGGVFADMLQEKVTKEAEETRDKNYRILREADKYDTSSIKMSVDENGEVTFTGTSSRLKKKTKADFIKHPPVYEEEGTRLRTIQDNKTFKTKQTLYGGANAQFAEEDMSHMYNNLDFDTTLTVTRDFIPRIPIDKFITKMVVRITESEERSFVDLYLPTKAGQFSKLDAIMVGNIYQMWETGNLKSDITEFKTLEITNTPILKLGFTEHYKALFVIISLLLIFGIATAVYKLTIRIRIDNTEVIPSTKEILLVLESGS